MTQQFKKFITRNKHLKVWDDLINRQSDYKFDDFYKTRTLESINVPKLMYSINDPSKYPPALDLPRVPNCYIKSNVFI